MRVSVNLATRPFVELRPLLARLRLAALALVLLAVGLGVGLHALQARAATAQAQMDALKAQTAQYTGERTRDEARMRQPGNQAVLQRSEFLNVLFARKSFSWTATLMDLERVLPAGVQVTSIDPVITKEGDVQIRLRVSGDRDRAIQLVRNLEHSQRFVEPRLVSETAMSKEKATALGAPGLQTVAGVPGGVAGTGVEFDILSGYNPLPTPELAAASKAVPEAAEAVPATSAVPDGYAGHQRRQGSGTGNPGAARTALTKAAPNGQGAR